jgi:hypothetical protein
MFTILVLIQGLSSKLFNCMIRFVLQDIFIRVYLFGLSNYLFCELNILIILCMSTELSEII